MLPSMHWKIRTISSMKLNILLCTNLSIYIYPYMLPSINGKIRTVRSIKLPIPLSIYVALYMLPSVHGKIRTISSTKLLTAIFVIFHWTDSSLERINSYLLIIFSLNGLWLLHHLQEITVSDIFILLLLLCL